MIDPTDVDLQAELNAEREMMRKTAAEAIRLKNLKAELIFRKEERMFGNIWINEDGDPNRNFVLKPRYVHDCDRCIHLMQRDSIDPEKYGPSGDYYVCPQGGWPTIVIRHSDDPPDYSSGDTLLRFVTSDDYDDTRAIAKSFMRHWRDKKRTSDRTRAARRQLRRKIRKAGGFSAWLSDILLMPDTIG